jgi:hypothetical protein
MISPDGPEVPTTLRATFVTIVLVEIACIGALYWFGVYFG